MKRGDRSKSVLAGSPRLPAARSLAPAPRISSLRRYEALVAEWEADLTPSWGRRPVKLLHWFEPFQTVLELEAPALSAGLRGAPPTWPNTGLRSPPAGPQGRKTLLDLGRRHRVHAPLHLKHELHAQVCRPPMPCWSWHRKEDLVALYMPMVPGSRHRHAALRPHRCAPNSVEFGWFSGEPLRGPSDRW